MTCPPPILAAGAVVWRERDGRLEVLLIHRPRYQDWSWPKGKLKAKEHLTACAVREIQEETGRRVVLGRPLEPVTYRLASGRIKLVHYWTARLADDDDVPALAARSPIGPVDPREIDAVKWFPADVARRRLTRASDHRPLDKVVKYHRSGRLATRSVVIVRHAQAVERDQWPGAEAIRPLTAQGRQRARRLSDVLAAYGVIQVISSPWMRCVRTVRPYAGRSRQRIVTSRWLSEGGAAASPQRTSRLVQHILTGGQSGVAVCTHRPVLPAVLAPLRQMCRSRVLPTVPDADPYLRTGACLVAHIAQARRGGGPRVVAVEIHRPDLPTPES